jgi:putative ABC transport system ATP-binding protein
MTPIIDGKDVTSMRDQQRVHLRRETVTYIFQSFSLLPGLSAAENVGVPLRIAGVAPKARGAGRHDAHACRPGRPRPAPAR